LKCIAVAPESQSNACFSISAHRLIKDGSNVSTEDADFAEAMILYAGE